MSLERRAPSGTAQVARRGLTVAQISLRLARGASPHAQLHLTADYDEPFGQLILVEFRPRVDGRYRSTTAEGVTHR